MDRRSMKFHPEKYILFYILIILLLISCSGRPSGDIVLSDILPNLEPDYTNVTVPPNIAPMNFIIKEPGIAFYVRLSSGSGLKIEVYSNKGVI